MTASKKDLQKLVEEARPLIEEWLEISDKLAAFRETATAMQIEWQPLKSLIKARVKDELDETGGDKNIKKLILTADSAIAYADTLGWGVEAKKLFSEGRTATVLTGVEGEPPRRSRERRPDA